MMVFDGPIYLEPTAKDNAKIVELFINGESVNHIVYLMDHQVRTDDVNKAIRRALVKSYECPECACDLICRNCYGC